MIKNPTSICQGKTKSGRPCRAAATSGGLCFFHANPKKASELGRLGGMRNRHVVTGGEPDPQSALDHAIAVRDRLARLVTDLDANKVHASVVNLMPPILNSELRAIETVAKLEDRLKSASSSRTRKRLDGTRKNGEEGTGLQVLQQASALSCIPSSSAKPAERENAQKNWSDDISAKRPPQAVKAYGSMDGKVAEK